MFECTDQLNRKVIFNSVPKRIVSLVPSQTELLYDLGLREEVIGITKFCIHPEEWFRSKHRVGGTKKINFNTIAELKPDLIIGNKEENDQSQVEKLMTHYPVWMSDIKTLDDALHMIAQVGTLVGKENESAQLKNRIRAQFDTLESKISNLKSKISCTYLIWKDPLITVGSDTFIHDMLTRCGFTNTFGDHKRYPEIRNEDLKMHHPNLLLLSSEPFPFKEKHLEEFQTLVPGSKIVLVDGELFSWYGSRLLKAPDYFRSLVNQFHARD